MLTVLSFLSLAQIVAPVPVPPPSATSSPALESPVARPTPVQQPSSNLPDAPVLIPPIQPPIVAPPPVTPPARQVEVVRSQEVRPLPGQLDEIPVFNSNSPEIIQTDGILLSTFPADGMRSAEAHLNYPLQGRFDLFAHHIAKGVTPEDDRTPFLGVIVYNPTNEPVTLDILQAVSYLSQEAPFVDLPSYVGNPVGNVFAGPGSRTTNDVLRGQRQPHWPAQVIIPPRRSQLLVNVPIPLRRLTVATDGTLPPGYIIPPAVAAAAPTTASRGAASLAGTAPTGTATAVTEVAASSNSSNSSSSSNPSSRSPSNRTPATNGRTILMHLSSSGPVYLASLAMYAPKVVGGGERVPSLQDWEALLRNGSLAVPRDRNPTPPDARAFLRFFYGRVAGVAQGSQWSALATDGEGVEHLSIPRPGEEFSYVISTVDHNTFGTGQIQSAPMLVRYPDTAYRAHGNYGIKYDISMPLYNHTNSTQRVAILLQTPVQDEGLESGLRFREPPDNQIFFRGTVRLRFTDDFGIPQTRYLHIVQRRGQQGEPLLQMTMPPGNRRLVEVQFIYPPDSTPPQVLTVRTQGNREIIEVRNE